jgi:hypothetical protein
MNTFSEKKKLGNESKVPNLIRAVVLGLSILTAPKLAKAMEEHPLLTNEQIMKLHDEYEQSKTKNSGDKSKWYASNRLTVTITPKNISDFKQGIPNVKVGDKVKCIAQIAPMVVKGHEEEELSVHCLNPVTGKTFIFD